MKPRNYFILFLLLYIFLEIYFLIAIGSEIGVLVSFAWIILGPFFSYMYLLYVFHNWKKNLLEIFFLYRRSSKTKINNEQTENKIKNLVIKYLGLVFLIALLLALPGFFGDFVAIGIMLYAGLVKTKLNTIMPNIFEASSMEDEKVEIIDVLLK